MGEENQPFQLSFNASLKVNFQGSRVTSDGGLVLVPELDERLRLSELIEHHLTDSQFPHKAVRTLRFLLGLLMWQIRCIERRRSVRCASRRPKSEIPSKF